MKLTVKELLEEIKHMNLDDQIYIEMYSGCCNKRFGITNEKK